MNIPFLRDIILERPEWLLALLALPLMMWWRGRIGKSPAVAFPTAFILRDLGFKAKSTHGGLTFGLILVSLAAAIVALARPQKVISHDEDNTEGIAICLTVDVSLSMLIEDFYIGGSPVNRLTAAKRVMRDFIRGRTSDRVGIVAFAGAPYQPCPLTLQRDWLESNLDRVQTGVMEDGTAIGSGLAMAARRLDKEKVPSKVIILLTDGANNSGKLSPLDAAKLAATLGQRIYTIAIGTPGVHMIPLPSGRIITSGRQEFDEGTLQEVARIGSGSFYMAQDLTALEEIFSTIDNLERTEIKRRSIVETEELFFVPAALAAALLGLALLLRLTFLNAAPVAVAT
ncbi:Ca-activated chloride channel family protein [Prosthecobacter fusiformis]|uniref:Ca-activated chloride channel family protein n=1 Tax=Prosthecobacter fusiformis TaxID=48464 RepID=A0A4R7RP61_9BACT|nr:VWA domain-containing protein [Prosthecobacter fusiformis]TDU67270.1 Ca-activated chloride channel family protein [Prosthecobacter fusiformis]